MHFIELIHQFKIRLIKHHMSNIHYFIICFILVANLLIVLTFLLIDYVNQMIHFPFHFIVFNHQFEIILILINIEFILDLLMDFTFSKPVHLILHWFLSLFIPMIIPLFMIIIFIHLEIIINLCQNFNNQFRMNR